MATDGFAPAKINLALHVTGRRADGYHLLDSLVVFADVGDRVTAAPAEALTLSVAGPMAAGVPAGEENLVLRAARLLRAADGPGAALALEKRLPAASGIGGGSSDAAAALRVLARLWGLPLPGAEAAAALGADVPVCLDPRPRRMRGTGEVLEDAPPLPPVWLALANPGLPVATQAVFAALAGRSGPPLPEVLPRCATAAELAAFLALQRNDLEAPALSLAPETGRARAALAAQPGCLLARMSGSGATAFGLFADPLAARAAAAAIRAAQPGWWTAAAGVLG